MKLDDRARVDLTARFLAGASPAELAQEFGVSLRTAQRVVQGVHRPEPRLEVAPGQAVVDALEALLAQLADPDALQVAAARALAIRLDNAGPRDAPALVTALFEQVEELRRASGPPSQLDLIRARRDAVRLLEASGYYDEDEEKP
jgi:hypothetical protein